jgi:hypothetical protein
MGPGNSGNSRNLNSNSRVSQNSQNSQNSNSINVQTNSQPVLVVPMNVNRQQMINSPAPGAPATLAFDTSEPAMRNSGISAPSNTRNNSASNSAPRSRSNSANSNTSEINSSTAPNVRVNVVKEG